MTREEKIAQLAVLKSEAEALCRDYNALMTEGKLAEATKTGNTIAEKCNEYTSHAREIAFEDCLATEDPMRTAVTILTFQTIAPKDDKKDEDAIPVRGIVFKDRYIDLVKLHRKSPAGIGVNKEWYHHIQKLNFLLTAQKCRDLGVDPTDISNAYEMSDIAKAFDMGKNPTSNSNMLRTLQTVVTSMLGDEAKATSHDVAYLQSVYAKKGRAALSVSCSRHADMVKHFSDICHRIVTGESYTVISGAQKK